MRPDSFDYNDYEGATYLHDFNWPIPHKYVEKYSVVYDGGTLEHVFNFPVGIRNAMDMVQIGGHLILIGPVNNAAGHGFWQYSPDLFSSLLNGNGFEIKDITLQRFITLKDIPMYRIREGSIFNRYPVLNCKCEQMLISVCAKKRKAVPDHIEIQQPFYSRIWEDDEISYPQVEYYEVEREIERVKGVYDESKKYNKSQLELVLYGAGKNCEKIVKKAERIWKERLRIIAIVDSDNGKWGKKICSNYVISPPFILESIDYDGVVITPMGKQGAEIEEILLVQYRMKWCDMFPLEKLEYYMDDCLY